MRAIKFRAWDKNHEKMFQVAKLEYGGKLVMVWYWNIKRAEWVWLEECELMQYTGLKDSHDVEVYEGDILKHDGLLFMVTWRDGRFEAIRKRKSHDDIRYIWNIGQPGIEVIGNIYENAELLADGK